MFAINNHPTYTLPGSRTITELQAFAVDVCEALRARPDWRNWETLEVGVRLDVGVSSAEGEGFFFVNEITRLFYHGDMGSSFTRSPHTEIPVVVAKAASEYIVSAEFFADANAEASEEGESTQ